MFLMFYDVFMIQHTHQPERAEPRCMSLSEARRYLGVGRRSFHAEWRPHLILITSGTRKLVDRLELDRLINAKRAAAGAHSETRAPALPMRWA